MSVDNVRKQIEAFLRSEAAEVLCIRGNWGTGKTYTWNDTLRSIDSIKNKNYSYVSLFGLNTLDDIKQEIFHQKKSINTLDKEFDPNDIKNSYENVWNKLKPATGILAKFLGDGYAGLGVSVMSYFIRDTIICIDDLERKGESLRSTDVLGLISQFKEERNCKVVLLLNDGQLEDRNEFAGFLEKVIDINLRFAPSPMDSTEIALREFADEDITREIRDRCVKLGIDNIRVIRKIFRSVKQISPLLSEYKPGVLKGVISSIVLLGWCHYQPEVAPPLDYVKLMGKFTRRDSGGDQVDQDGVDRKWATIIRDYGYMHTDDFDLALLEGIASGYFDKNIIAGYAADLHQREQSSEANAKLDRAWSIFRNSFSDDKNDLESEIWTCFSENSQYYSLYTTVQSINILRKIGSEPLAEKIISNYISVNKDNANAFDIERLYRFGEDPPKDIVDRIIQAGNATKPDLSLDKLLILLSDHGFNSDTANQLAKAPVKEYVRVLQTHEGADLRKIRDGLTSYINVSNPNEAAITIMDKAGEALKVIATQSKLNAARAEGWGLIQRLDRKNERRIRNDDTIDKDP